MLSPHTSGTSFSSGISIALLIGTVGLMSVDVMNSHRPILVEALARAMAARDGSTHEHAERVQRYAVGLAQEIGIGDVRMLRAIDAAALLHDVGKLGIPDQVLNKPGPLTPDEYELVKEHAAIGADLLAAVPFNGPLALIVRHHHENWDGTGYPNGLRGLDIPVGARVLAIADCYDALTSDRPYRPALSHEAAVAMIRERRATMYDADLVDTFLRIVQRLRRTTARPRISMPKPRRAARRLEARAI
jgi:putative nucleotidyltransferase with HDIG domain